MKNKIAWKLTAYFATVLLLFALGVGMTFAHFFAQHTVAIKKTEMHDRAVKIAEVINDNMEFLEKRYGNNISNSRFIQYMDNVTMEYVWVIDAERNLNLNAAADHHSRMRRHRARELEANPKAAYNALSPAVKARVDEIFAGKSFTLEEFNPVLEDIFVTVGVPVYNRQGDIKAAVLLNAPVQGIKEAAWAGTRILVISCLIALILSFVLSIIFSLNFTKPLNIMKNIAERLADKDYKARCNIKRGDEIGDLAATLDILSERLQLADEESQKLENLRREFIANISHELRTPVTVIRGSLEALLDDVVTDKDEVKDFHKQMLNESVFLQRLINDLLDLSRLQNTDFPIEKNELNLCDAVQDAVRGSRQLGAEKNINITAAFDSDIYVIDGDYGRLRQMLMIFLHNSIKFSPENSVVEVSLNGNKLTVLDHGCGMKADDLTHAFERFYKARNEANKSGSGLGLAIAKQIALRHNMQLDLDSVSGEYTKITVTLPPKKDV